MSERPIQKGDLVMLVRGHSCSVARIGGIPFTVTGIHASESGGFWCSNCGKRSVLPAATYATGYGRLCVPLSWLKRIDPGILDENIQEVEKLHA